MTDEITALGPQRRVALVTLGCARNDVDSEELAGRLAGAGWLLVDDAAEADVAVVNTCGFIDQAKKDSIDTVLQAAEVRDDASTRTQAVVAVGCMAERYGVELAESLPEADAVLGFDSYADLASHLDGLLHGVRPASHVPRDRRTLLPVAPAARRAATVPASLSPAPAGYAGVLTAPAAPDLTVPAQLTTVPSGLAAGPLGAAPVRARLSGAPWAALKLAGGCDRRCTFCAIPAFRGAFVSRDPAEVLAEAAWLAARGVREAFLVSENTTSYGKDLGDLRLLEALLPQVAAVEGIARVRVSYLQPAEVRPGLLEALAGTEGVVPYFDLSFQHSAPAVLRRMRRFGGTQDFLRLIEQVRALAPTAGIRSNVIVGFPGESEDDVEELMGFLEEARLDVVGVFGYSDEEGTEAVGLDGHHDDVEIAARVEQVSSLVDELVAQRAEDRIGELVQVLVEEEDPDEPGVMVGRAAHQGPEVDGVCRFEVPGDAATAPAVGALVEGVVIGNDGADLVVRPVSAVRGPSADAAGRS